MGQVIHKWMEDEARGYSDPPEKLTCSNHFNDENIVKFIDGECDYCGQNEKIIDLATLLDFINGKIKNYYGDINDQNLFFASSFGLNEDGICEFHDEFGYTFPNNRSTFENIKVISVGLFKTIKGLKIIDFTELPSNISMFGDYDFHMMKFLKSFVGEIAQSYEHNDKIHIEYVPTQIITEYFRHIFRTEKHLPINGLIYNSAENKDGKCCVLFLDSKSCSKYLGLDSFKRKKLIISAI